MSYSVLLERMTSDVMYLVATGRTSGCLPAYSDETRLFGVGYSGNTPNKLSVQKDICRGKFLFQSKCHLHKE